MTKQDPLQYMLKPKSSYYRCSNQGNSTLNQHPQVAIKVLIKSMLQIILYLKVMSNSTKFKEQNLETLRAFGWEQVHWCLSLNYSVILDAWWLKHCLFTCYATLLPFSCYSIEFTHGYWEWCVALGSWCRLFPVILENWPLCCVITNEHKDRSPPMVIRWGMTVCGDSGTSVHICLLYLHFGCQTFAWYKTFVWNTTHTL